MSDSEKEIKSPFDENSYEKTPLEKELLNLIEMFNKKLDSYRKTNQTKKTEDMESLITKMYVVIGCTSYQEEVDALKNLKEEMSALKNISSSKKNAVKDLTNRWLASIKEEKKEFFRASPQGESSPPRKRKSSPSISPSRKEQRSTRISANPEKSVVGFSKAMAEEAAKEKSEYEERQKKGKKPRRTSI